MTKIRGQIAPKLEHLSLSTYRVSGTHSSLVPRIEKKWRGVRDTHEKLLVFSFNELM